MWGATKRPSHLLFTTITGKPWCGNIGRRNIFKKENWLELKFVTVFRNVILAGSTKCQICDFVGDLFMGGWLVGFSLMVIVKAGASLSCVNVIQGAAVSLKDWLYCIDNLIMIACLLKMIMRFMSTIYDSRHFLFNMLGNLPGAEVASFYVFVWSTFLLWLYNMRIMGMLMFMMMATVIMVVMII